MTPEQEDALIERATYGWYSCDEMREQIRLAIRAAYAQGREDAQNRPRLWRQIMPEEMNPNMAPDITLPAIKVETDAIEIDPIRAAVAQERERCANVVFDLSDGQYAEIAAAIRRGDD